MIGLYISFLLFWSYKTVKGFNTSTPTPKPTPYYHLRLVTPKNVIEGKVNR